MNRRSFLKTSFAFGSAAALNSMAGRAMADGQLAAASQPTTEPKKPQPRIPENIEWHDVREWGVEGKGFTDTEKFFDRLPARAKGAVRLPVWELSKDTSGLSAHFQADTPAVYVRYELTSERLASPHMPASGVSGLDLYAQHDGKWSWLATHMPNEMSYAGPLANGIFAERRAYHINLPLYNGVKSLEIGVPKDAYFKPIPPRKEKAILFYGTSITQGGCASRPGMCFVNILGRRLDRPILNFGFSGNGRMELEVGRFLAELDPAIFVIDCVGNCSLADVQDHTEPLVTLLRAARASTPVLLLERPLFPTEDLRTHPGNDVPAKNAALRKAYENLLAAGVAKVYYRIGEGLIGTDGEATVDGSHPSDLGMMRYADGLEPTLRDILAMA